MANISLNICPSQPAPPSPTVSKVVVTQGLWRFPDLCIEAPNIIQQRTTNNVSTTLESKIGGEKSILDIPPHQFWNQVTKSNNNNRKDILVLINVDLVCDRLRNQSLPWYYSLPSPFLSFASSSRLHCWSISAYFTAILTATPEHYHETSTLVLQTSTGTSTPQSLAT